MTIEEMLTMTTMLEATTQEKINALLQEPNQNFDEHTFWRDVRSGYRQAESALTALRLIEEGRDWN